MAIEQPPHIEDKDLLSAMILPENSQVSEIVDKINETFEYWDSIKYKKCPLGCTSQQLWTMVKASRIKNSIRTWDKYGLRLSLTNAMQKMCHHFDMSWGGSWLDSSTIDANNKEQ